MSRAFGWHCVAWPQGGFAWLPKYFLGAANDPHARNVALLARNAACVVGNLMERWQMRDPFEVVARMQEQEQRRYAKSRQGKADRARQGIEELFGDHMTQDQSEQIEHLLEVWYGHERAYTPALGAPRVSVSCRGHDAGDVHDDGHDRDAKLNKVTAEAVGACVDELHYLQRAAIGVHMRNKTVRAAVHRNPRIEDQHAAYQEAKLALWPKLKRKGLVR